MEPEGELRDLLTTEELDQCMSGAMRLLRACRTRDEQVDTMINLVYTSNQLTLYYSSLFYKAKLAIADGFFASRWLSNQGVSVKLLDGTIHKIKSVEDIASLTNVLAPGRNLSVTTVEEDYVDAVPFENQPTIKPSRSASSTQQLKIKKASKSDEEEESLVTESKRGKSNKSSSNQMSLNDTNAVTKP